MPRERSEDISWRTWALACAAVVLAGIAARAFVHTRSTITPAIDGAYYAIQPRSLLQTGHLDYPDMPLKFAIDAVLARALQATAVPDLNDACMRASQATDCLLPPLIAVPLLLLGHACARGRTALWISLGACTMLVLGGPAMRMTADFQKNSLALVGYAAMLQQACVALRRWPMEGVRAWPAAARSVAWLALTGLVHAGTGATAALNLLLVALAGAIATPELRRRAFGLAGLVTATSAAALLAASFALLRWLDPARAARMLQTPTRLLQGATGDAEPHRGPAMMGPNLWPFMATIALAAIACWLLLRTASRAPRWARAAGLACAVTSVLLTVPVLNADSANRLALVAVVPAAAAFVMAFATGTPSWRGAWPGWVVMAIALATLPGSARFASSPCIDPDSLEELRGLGAEVPEHRRALLVARHGLEFWANLAIDVNTRQSGIPADAFDRYDRVLVLTEVRPFRPAGPPPDRLPGRRGGGPPMWGPGMGGPGMPPPGAPPGRGGMRPPPGSRLVFEGRFYRLFEVPRDAHNGESDDDAPIDG